MTVITISRQMGSLGCQVADEIARCLNYRVVWREVINEAASRAGVPEVALATIDELDLLGLRPSAEARKAYHAAVHQIMSELYREGNVVIVGRAGQVLLRGKPGVLHVRIYAPFELRVARIAQQHNVLPDTAHALALASDKSRTAYLKRYYQSRWDDPDLYDVMINTENLSVEDTAKVVCRAMEHSKGADQSESKGTSSVLGTLSALEKPSGSGSSSAAGLSSPFSKPSD